MITIFGLLGLIFLGGGAWAIFDGWPYMVLERGFTQVIIGSVAATGGVILLALAWVMMELRQVKASVSNAAAALAMASLSPGGQMQAAWPSPKSEPQPMPDPFASPALAPAALGMASAGAALAVAGRAAESVPEPIVEPQIGADDVAPPKAEAAEPTDTRWLAADDGVATSEPSLPPFPPRTEPVDAVDVPPVETAYDPEPQQDAPPARPEADVDPIEAAISAALGEQRAGMPIDAPAPVVAIDEKLDPRPLAESSIWWPEINASAEVGPADPEPAIHSAGEPASLRERLDIGPALPQATDDPVAQTAQPTAEAEKPVVTLDAAEAWMNPVFSRREPFFGEPSAHPVPGEPSWPPSPVVPEPAQVASAAQDDEPSSDRFSEERQALPPAAEPEEQPAVTAAEDAPPAASDEGVIGAYQVGEAHFTLFADGSIKARTPDGDYDFGSMDELKIYLASEKSRLGV